MIACPWCRLAFYGLHQNWHLLLHKRDCPRKPGVPLEIAR